MAAMAIMATLGVLSTGFVLLIPIIYVLYRWAGGRKSLRRWVADL